ncbi:MAG: hypothetical protein LBE35_02860 [Clostridiales bacterium]|jgi:hypothetical protein|nr:hypothetical protein [Clostridiales bacterium]
MQETRIIAAHAGTGKSYLAGLKPEEYIDFICMPFKYHFDEGFGEGEGEAIKASPDLELNWEYPENYVEAIVKTLAETEKTLIIPSDSRVLHLLQGQNIPYLLCYPENSDEAKEEYHRRFIARGNTEDFIDIFIGGWDYFMQSLQRDSFGQRMVMKPHEYLSDIVSNIANLSQNP